MKNKKIFTLSIIIFFVFIIGYLVMFNGKKSSIKHRKPIHDFQITDTASITRIVLSDKSPSKVELTRNENNQWKVNNTHSARKNSIDILLYTLASMEMKNYVPKSAEQNVLKNLSSSATQVKVYKKRKLVKHFYVGGEPQDLLGTYMMINESSKPFVVHIPGFNGFLSSRFFTDELLWKDRTFCNLPSNKIRSIEVNYLTNEFYKKKSNSFKIERTKNNYELINKNSSIKADFSKSEIYFSFFKNLQIEAFINDMSEKKIDSILKTVPVFNIKIIDTSNKTYTLKAFYKKPKKNQTSKDGQPLKHDIDRLFSLVNDTDFCIIQYYVFDKILKSKKYFLKTNS